MEGRGGEGSRVISEGRLVLVLVMYQPRATTREGSFKMGLSWSTLVTSFSRRSRPRSGRGSAAWHAGKTLVPSSIGAR